MDIRSDPVDPPPVLEELLTSTFYEWSCDHFSQPLLVTRNFDEFSPQMLLKQKKIREQEMIEKEAFLLNKSSFFLLFFVNCRLYKFNDKSF